MGTLTADVPRLDEHCLHKLASSCRLTSTSNCCACADERPHSRTYSKYIDGVGFVQRGTRWQSYCWFCKEFWTNRIACTDPPLLTSQTQIPLIPDQSEFLRRWFEFHQGYRIVTGPDGCENRIAVIGEPFREVSPGFLPRTLDQLREGIPNDESMPENRFPREKLESEEQTDSTPQQSIEEALDNLLDEVEQEDDMIPLRQQRGSRHAEEQSNANAPITRRQSRLQRAADRATRVFGTREDVQQDDYQSPISGMYSRAMERYQQAEAQRRSTNEQPPGPMFRRLSRRFHRSQVPTAETSNAPALDDPSTLAGINPLPPAIEISEIATGWDIDASTPLHYPALQAANSRTEADQNQLPDLQTVLVSIQQRDTIHLHPQSSFATPTYIEPRREPTPLKANLDTDNRPSAKSEKDMMVKLQCKVCYDQIADIAVLPCGHMVMCQWCADIEMPVKHGHIPEDRGARCPMCRKRATQRYKIHIG